MQRQTNSRTTRQIFTDKFNKTTMKRFLMLVVAVMALALPAAQAQRINLNSELNKLAKVDAAIENVKKNTKASTWIARGQAYADAYMLPTKDLGRGVPVATLQLNVGQPNEIVEGELQGVPAFVCNYDYIDVYLVNGLIEAWVRKAEIAENLPETVAHQLFAVVGWLWLQAKPNIQVFPLCPYMQQRP